MAFAKRKAILKRAQQKKGVAQMIDPETKAALGPMSTLMRFQGGEKVDFVLLQKEIFR
jgi:hypothetical protein